MSTNLNSTNLSDIIKNATDNIISKTEESISTLNDKPLSDSTVTVTINGIVTTLNKEDYDKIKSENSLIHSQMKSEIKNVINDFKTNLKSEIKSNI